MRHRLVAEAGPELMSSTNEKRRSDPDWTGKPFVRELLRVSDMLALGRLAADEAAAQFGVQALSISWNTERIHADGRSESSGRSPDIDLEGAEIRRIPLFSASNGTRA